MCCSRILNLSAILCCSLRLSSKSQRSLKTSTKRALTSVNVNQKNIFTPKVVVVQTRKNYKMNEHSVLQYKREILLTQGSKHTVLSKIVHKHSALLFFSIGEVHCAELVRSKKRLRFFQKILARSGSLRSSSGGKRCAMSIMFRPISSSWLCIQVLRNCD